MKKRIKILIVGGCFPVQDNIEKDHLYHQLVKEKLVKQKNIDIDIRIIRYEIVSQCFYGIVEAVSLEKPDIILFHIRIEPLLGLLKFYYEYYDASGQKVCNLNASYLNLRYKKKVRRGSTSNISKSERKIFFGESVMHKLLREINFLLGKIFGNMKSAFSQYSELIEKLIHFCEQNEIKLFFTGPVSRPRSLFENYYSRKLHVFVNLFLTHRNAVYINCLGEKDKNGDSLFCEDQIRVNEKGHARIAELIYAWIINQNTIAPHSL